MVAPATPPPDADNAPSVSVSSLRFAYPDSPPVVDGVTLDLPRGARCLLVGANGAGKTTLLEVLAGKHMVNRDAVRILGRPAFYDLMLVTSGELEYLGNQWRRSVACAGSDLSLQGDISAEKMIWGVVGVDPTRRSMLIEMLDIDLSWRLNKVSDGQRRRVQICLGLLKPYEVLLLDEITVDMDVVGRLDLLEFFKRECEERGATIIYATHIFDGLAPWITHLAYLEGGHMLKGGPVASVPEVRGDQKLLHVVERWLRHERDTRQQRQADAKPLPAKPATPAAFSAASRHMAFYR